MFIGGCGAIFEVFISTKEFKGMSMVKQHQLINEVCIMIYFNYNQAHIQKTSRMHIVNTNSN